MRLSYILMLLVGFVVMAEAHPHVFADVSIKALFSQDAFTGVQNHWSFDEVYSAAMFASADENGDSKITGKEIHIKYVDKQKVQSKPKTSNLMGDLGVDINVIE